MADLRSDRHIFYCHFRCNISQHILPHHSNFYEYRNASVDQIDFTLSLHSYIHPLKQSQNKGRKEMATP